MDIKSINLPDLSFTPTKEKEFSDDDVFVYATFAKPGLHQLLIYDPQVHRAFCKDFMVNLNLREDVFPEYPIIEGLHIRKGIKNVFELWKDETEIQVSSAWEMDMKRS